MALLALSGILLVTLEGSIGALGAYVAAMALGLLYSIRPVRFKGRGLLGPMTYSLSGVLAFVAVPWAWLGSEWHTLAVLAPAVLLDKWVNLLFHQVVDYQADLRGGVRTHAVALGLGRARRWLKWAAGLATVWLLGLLVFMAFSLPAWRVAVTGIGGAAILAVGLYARAARTSARRSSPLLQELPWTYLGLTYAVFRALPLVLFARLTLLEPAMWVPFAMLALLLLLESRHALRYGHD